MLGPVSTITRISLLAGAVMTSASAFAQDTGPIRIGLIAPLTGVQAAIGAQHRDGALAAADFLNAKGGVLGRKIEIVLRDSQFQPANAAAAARDLVQEKVVAVMGDVAANTAAAQYAIMNQAGIPMFTPSPAKKDLDPKVNPMLFTNGGAGEYVAWGAADYLVTNLKLTKICGIGDLQAVSRFDPLAREFLKTKGVTPIATESFPTTATDVSVQLKALKDAGCEALMAWAFGPPIVTIARSLQAIDWHPAVAGTPGLADLAIIDAVGAEALKNFYADTIGKNFLVKKAGDPPNPKIRDYVESYRKYNPKLVGLQQAVYEWDNVMIIAQAIEKAGKADSAAIVKVMESGVPLEVTRGTFRFSATDHTGLELSELGLAQGGIPNSDQGTWVAAPGILP